MTIRIDRSDKPPAICPKCKRTGGLQYSNLVSETGGAGIKVNCRWCRHEWNEAAEGAAPSKSVQDIMNRRRRDAP